MKSRGFSLIELLVVVSIIGVLASLVIGSLHDIRIRARDTRRLADMKSIQTSLELYYLLHGEYPRVDWASSHLDSWGGLESVLGQELPVDPLNITETTSLAPFNDSYFYGYYGAVASSRGCSGQAYLLVINLEGVDDRTSGVELCDGYFYGYGDSMVVGVDRYGNLVAPGI